MSYDTLKPAVVEDAEGVTEFQQPVVEELTDTNATMAAGAQQNVQHTWNADPPLRTDGPTLAEYVAAGYPANTYPPKGYASREPVNNDAKLVQRIPLASRQSIADNVDELSIAAKTAMAPVHVAAPEVKLPPGRFKLAYEYNGQKILERHRTIPHALASIRRLKMMGIVPATSTDPAPASQAA